MLYVNEPSRLQINFHKIHWQTKTLNDIGLASGRDCLVNENLLTVLWVIPVRTTAYINDDGILMGDVDISIKICA